MRNELENEKHVPTTNGDCLPTEIDYSLECSDSLFKEHVEQVNTARRLKGLEKFDIDEVFKKTGRDKPFDNPKPRYNLYISKSVEKENEEPREIKPSMNIETFTKIRDEQDKNRLRMRCYEEVKELWFQATDNKEQKFNDIVEVIVKYLEEVYTFKSIKDDEKIEIWYYEEGIYLPNAISQIKEELRLILKERITNKYVNAVTLRIETSNYIKSDEFFNQQNEEPYLIPINNCLFNLKTKEKEQFTNKKYFFNKLPLDYDTKAKCPNIIKFITEITKRNGQIEDRAIKGIQEMIGYCLVKNYKYQNAFMLEGERGANGKSVLCKLIETFVNKKNVTNAKIETLKDDSFNLVELQNKLVNFSSEVSKNSLDNPDVFKKLTGGDGITANRKFKNKITFENYAKMIFTANKLPTPKNPDDGFWRRWVRIEFPNKYLSEFEINKLPVDQRKNVFLKDDELINKITTQEELNGLFIWSLEGLDRLQRNGDFTRTQSIKENELEWIKKNNSILAFCESHIQTDYENYITKEEFRKQYSIYCKSHNVKPMGDQSIKIHLENELFAEDSQIRIKDQNGYVIERPRVWKGVSFINKPSSDSNVTGNYPIFTSAKEVKNSPLEVKPPESGVTVESKPQNNDNFFINNSSNDEVVEEDIKPEGVLQAILYVLSEGTIIHLQDIISKINGYSVSLIEEGIVKLCKVGDIYEIEPDYYRIKE